ncbi:hypothetical protein PUN28_000323 [Cardiocondyla obscurior]|uniref:ERAP1-like C-terminal domain-containing protein n=1 Tax=Cardiocondyla obscurior TaxID=286306 RepID=A0AAW2GYV3_9HYME
MSATDETFRLPREVIPITYDLLLHPKLQKGTFSGKVTILIDVRDDRRTIALHQKDLNITSAKLTTYGLNEDYEIDISSISQPTKYEIFVISTKNEIKSGLYNLSLEFTGNLRDKIIGFYSSTYRYNNETRYIATTKFEPTYARQSFPCFDEPEFKAEFLVKLVYPMDDCYSALSNMDVKKLPAADRANLLDDLFSLADAAELEYDIVMDVIMYLTEEYHALPWTVVKSKLMTMYKLLASTNENHLVESFQSYVIELVRAIYNDISWTIDTVEDTSLTQIDNRARAVVIELACAMGLPECLKKAGELFDDWLLLQKPQHPDISELIYYYGTRYHSDENKWRGMLEKFKHETDPSEKNKLMAGLAGIHSTKLLREYITLVTDEKYVRTQDFLKCLTIISKNPDGTSLVWDWVRENWGFLVNRYSLNDRYLGELIPSVTSSFATQTKLDEIKAFFEKYPEAGAGAESRAKTLETVTKNIKWLAKNSKPLNNWLQKNLHL